MMPLSDTQLRLNPKEIKHLAPTRVCRLLLHALEQDMYRHGGHNNQRSIALRDAIAAMQHIHEAFRKSRHLVVDTAEVRPLSDPQTNEFLRMILKQDMNRYAAYDDRPFWRSMPYDDGGDRALCESMRADYTLVYLRDLFHWKDGHEF